MTARVVGIQAVILALGTFLTVTATAQPAGWKVYSNPACGFRVSQPEVWREVSRSDAYIQLSNGEDPPTFVIIGPIRDERATGVPGEALANAVAGKYCLNCMARELTWIGRFASGSTTGTYVISNYTRKFRGQRQEGYTLIFVITTDGTPRGLRPGDFIYAEMEFWVPQAQFQRTESVIMDMARSIQFMKPEKPEGCWSAR